MDKTGIAIFGTGTAVVLVAAAFFLHADAVPVPHPALVAPAAPPVASIATTTPSTPKVDPVPVPAAPSDYIEVEDSCGTDWSGTCVIARTKPDASSTVALRLRTGMVLEVATTTSTDANDGKWYRVVFNEWLRYPERVKGDWYVSADLVRPFTEIPADDFSSTTATTTKHIIVDRSEQKLYAYDGDTLFMTAPVSTGLDLTPTPRGEFTIYHKTPTRYMQGPLPGISDQFYDLPGVPWDLYFTPEGGAIHGAYWHNHFGEEWSHGCVNLPLDDAHRLYNWAPVGTQVLVRD